MNGITRNQVESSMSIPVYEGSMVSLRAQSSNILVEKSTGYKSFSENIKTENIKWKCGKLPSEFQCSYCFKYLKFPVQFQECGHRVCSACLTDLLKQSSVCPTCKIQFDREKVTVDKEFQKALQNLEVYCINDEIGCKWEGIFKNLLLHLEECDYAMIDCKSGCGKKYLRKNKDDHIKEDCLKNDTQCEFCKSGFKKEQELAHLNVCPDFLVPCPYQCGKNEIKRKEVPSHLENECVKHEISCPFSDSGCNFKSLRTEMGKHMKESPGIHLNLLCKTVSLQKQQMQLISDIIEKQKKEIQEVNVKVNSFEKIFGPQFIWKIDNYSEKLNESKTGKKTTIFSSPFLTSRHGFKMALSTALYGDGKAKGKYMSLYVCICKGEYDALLQWPFSHKITLTLVDQTKNLQEQRPISYTIKPNTCKENYAFLGRPFNDRNASFGAQKFVELEVLNNFEYIVDDTFFIKVEVNIDSMISL